MKPSSPEVLRISPQTCAFAQRADTIGMAQMAFCVPLDASCDVHAGWAHWDEAQAPPKTLDYDEVLLVLAGTFGVVLQDGRSVMAQAGQALFIPKGTTVHYQGSQAKVFFAISTPESVSVPIPAASGA